MIRVVLFFASLLACLFFSPNAEAHKISDANLRIEIDGKNIYADWSLPLSDLILTANLKDYNDAINFALNHLPISTPAGPCKLSLYNQTPGHVQETAADIRFDGVCPEPVMKLTVSYDPFIVINHQYRMMVKVTSGDNVYATILSSTNRVFNFDAGQSGAWRQFRDYLHAGIWHIWAGYDHVLFLISLLLPSAFILRGGAWQANDNARGAMMQALKIITSFTLAHSVTLGLVIFNLISMPSRFVESVIALSIAIAAANNLKPVLSDRLWQMAFFFGLIHGMGFAGVLQELGLPEHAKWTTLAAFNLGVEAGQATIIVMVLPLIFALRNHAFYRGYALPALSAAIIVVALVWFAERAFGG